MVQQLCSKHSILTTASPLGLVLSSSLQLLHNVRHGSHLVPPRPQIGLSLAPIRRAGCGSERGWPELSSHFCPERAPQVGQRIASTCFGLGRFSMVE
jgi:hypothetical protein